MAAKKAANKKVITEEINGLKRARQYKYAKDRVFGFEPYERRVIMTCYDRSKRPLWTRWFVRIETARRRMIDLAEDNCKIGDVIEVAHIRGLQYYTAKIGVDGVVIKRNKEAFI